MPMYPHLYGEIKTDVLVIGGGLAGLLCAHRLREAGVDCVVLEADRIGRGTTGKTTGKITSQHGLIYGKLLKSKGEEAALVYWQANEKALREYRRLAEQADFDFETKDNYIYTRKDPRKLDREMEALLQIGIPGDFTETTDLPFPVAGAIRFRNQGQFHPLKFMGFIARDLKIYERTPVLGFDGNRVITNHGSVTAEKIIVATHFPIFNKHGAYFLKLYQSRSYFLALNAGQKLNGMYLDAEKGGLSLRNQGEALLLGMEDHRTGKRSPGWNRVEAEAKRYYPGSKILNRWAAQDCMTLDGIAYIGQYASGTDNLYVATGFQKWGMTSTMVASMVLTDRILGKQNPYQQLFSPQRSMLTGQLLINMLESTVHLLKPTVPRCPHMGCALKWNRQERSWDCPCHGSRFDEHGNLLENPATGGMKQSRSR